MTARFSSPVFVTIRSRAARSRTIRGVLVMVHAFEVESENVSDSRENLPPATFFTRAVTARSVLVVLVSELGWMG